MHTAELKQTGLKTTLPRLKVLDIIRLAAPRHLSAEDVYRRMAEQHFDVAIATVYRILARLEAVGLLSRSVLDSGKAVFELNEDGGHHHLICTTCGLIHEFQDQVIESRLRDAATSGGYQLKTPRLALQGSCQHCTQRSMADAAGTRPRQGSAALTGAQPAKLDPKGRDAAAISAIAALRDNFK